MRRIVLLTVVVLLLSACKVKVEQGFELKADGSGEATMIVAFDQEAYDMLASTVPGGMDPTEAMTSDAPPGWESKEWSEGGFTGFEASTSFTDVTALQNLVASTFSGEEGMFESFSAMETGDGFRIDGVLSGESLEQSVQDDAFAGAAEDMMESFFEASIAIKLPGEVTSHNADEVRSDGTLVWNVGVTDGGRAIRAESGPGTQLPIIPMAAGVLVLGAAIAGLLTWRRRQPPANPISRLEYTADGKPTLVAVDSSDPYA